MQLNTLSFKLITTNIHYVLQYRRHYTVMFQLSVNLLLLLSNYLTRYHILNYDRDNIMALHFSCAQIKYQPITWYYSMAWTFIMLSIMWSCINSTAKGHLQFSYVLLGQNNHHVVKLYINCSLYDCAQRHVSFQNINLLVSNVFYFHVLNHIHYTEQPTESIWARRRSMITKLKIDHCTELKDLLLCRFSIIIMQQVKVSLFFVPPFIDICLVLYAWNENTSMLWSDKALLTKYKLSFVEIHA